MCVKYKALLLTSHTGHGKEGKREVNNAVWLLFIEGAHNILACPCSFTA